MFSRFLRALKNTGIAAGAVVMVALCVANRGAVDISLFPLPHTVSMPKFLFALACFALGAVTAGLILGSKHLAAKRLQHQDRRRLAAVENELEGLKTEIRQPPAALPQSNFSPLPQGRGGSLHE